MVAAEKKLAYAKKLNYILLRMPIMTGTSVLKLLLIVAMVVQPVSFSYTMAGMSQSHHDTAALNTCCDGQECADISLKDMVDSHGMIHHMDDSSVDNCCDTVACGQAFVAGEITVLQNSPSPQFLLSIDTTVNSIDLPVEIKPPRPLLS